MQWKLEMRMPVDKQKGGFRTPDQHCRGTKRCSVRPKRLRPPIRSAASNQLSTMLFRGFDSCLREVVRSVLFFPSRTLRDFRSRLAIASLASISSPLGTSFLVQLGLLVAMLITTCGPDSPSTL